ncbi:PREDICTED: uncharacterized protein LOC105570039 [Vollenhovia emeryi]|uniref:uncharacterized protein LOC105570039 n=1 Tax=Vollenhovia emeryi TaxID=411798 RepID=UPI0005F542FC|nr:PREDICTED: uncharacterized protein LOC105570039 [Vollenhovia emeryi]
MTDSVSDDSVTKLNTQLNRSMVLMENVVDPPSPNPKRRSITINAKARSSKTAGSPVKSRKSILKKSEKPDGNVTSDDVAQQSSSNTGRLSETLDGASPAASALPRPRTLVEMAQREALNVDSKSATFSLEDVSDSEEFWIMDVPRSIEPQELHGRTIDFGEKSKFRIKSERYCIVAHNASHSVTCVLNSTKDALKYKTVNIKPAGFLSVRRKLTGAPEVKPVSTDNAGVQFPDNLKTRHPLFGVIRERKRRSRKHSCKT